MASYLVIGMAGCASERDMLAGSADPDVALEQTVLREIAARGLMEGGGVVAHVRSIALHEPVRVWRYALGQYMGVDSAALERALGPDRGKWPRRTAYFTIERADNDVETVELWLLYDAGLSPGTRGGEGHRWELHPLEGGGWEVREVGPVTVQD